MLENMYLRKEQFDLSITVRGSEKCHAKIICGKKPSKFVKVGLRFYSKKKLGHLRKNKYKNKTELEKAKPGGFAFVILFEH